MLDVIKTLKLSCSLDPNNDPEGATKEKLILRIKASHFQNKKYALVRAKKRNVSFKTWFPHSYKIYEVNDNEKEILDLYDEIAYNWKTWVRPKPMFLGVLSQENFSAILEPKKAIFMFPQENKSAAIDGNWLDLMTHGTYQRVMFGE